MKKLIATIIIVLLNFSGANSQEDTIDHNKIKEDLDQIIEDISMYYTYLDEKGVDLICIKEFYEQQIPNIKTEEQTVLFFEYLLNEFYDNHLNLNTNRDSSFRLYSPFYATVKNGKPILTNIWSTQIENPDQNLIGAEILMFNGIDFNMAIEQFPSNCSDKNSEKTREWIINRILSGRRNQPRILTLKLITNETMELDLDKLKIKEDTEVLTSRTEDGMGIIRINNSLGNNDLISEFDKALDALMDTRGLIIDLRNTVDGGNSYVARGIMGRFIDEKKPYQVHSMIEKYDGNSKVERSWIEFVTPRKGQYTKPVVILVGRWTGSMGEGLAIGFEGMERAQIVGTEMERLAGEMHSFPFKNQPFGYRLSVAKLLHVNGTPREKYVPKNYVTQTTTEKDETLEKGIELIKELTK